MLMDDDAGGRNDEMSEDRDRASDDRVMPWGKVVMSTVDERGRVEKGARAGVE
jgi:hypothetical protein